MTGPLKGHAVDSWMELRDNARSFLNDQLSGQRDGRLETSMDDDSPDTGKLRRGLKALPRRVAPADLRIRLSVIASRESQRRRARASWSDIWSNMRQDVRLLINNMMRPLAIPTAGGFVSAVLLFGVLSASIATPGVAARTADVPTMLYTGASVSHFIPVGFASVEDLVVEITVDEHGRLLDYSIPNADSKTQHLRGAIANQILFTQFTPATSFGQKISGGKVKITFTSSRIDIKG